MFLKIYVFCSYNKEIIVFRLFIFIKKSIISKVLFFFVMNNKDNILKAQEITINGINEAIKELVEVHKITCSILNEEM